MAGLFGDLGRVDSRVEPQRHPACRRSYGRAASGEFTRRIVRAYSRRMAAGDVEALAALVDLGTQVESAIRDAVLALHDFGYSWTEIASRLGITRQAARQRWTRTD